MRLNLFTKIIVSALLLCGFVVNASAKGSIATVSPIAYSMTKALVEKTDIKVDYLPPARLPVNRISSWLYKNRTEVFDGYDAFVTMKSLRPELDFYTTLRTSNIRVVPIDIAIALVPGGENVAYEQSDDYFWLNINNALLSLGILKRDLIALWPGKADQIQKNYFTTSSELRSLVSEAENHLLESGVEAIVVDSSSLLPFAKSLSLPLLSKEEADGFKTVIISSKKGDNHWVIDDFSRFKKANLITRWKNNINGLNLL